MNYTKQVAALMCASLPTTFALAQEPAKEPKDVQVIHQRIDQMVDKYTRAGGQAGMIFGIIKDGKPYLWSYGKLNPLDANSSAPTKDSLFNIESITKSYTGTLLAIETLKGRVKIMENQSNAKKETPYRVKDLWKELAGSQVGEIRLIDLATHTAGLPEDMPHFVYSDLNESQALEYLRNFPVPSGMQPWSYSNAGAGLLGFLLSRKLNGMDYPSYVQREILSKAGMSKTSNHSDTNDCHTPGFDAFLDPAPDYGPSEMLDGARTLRSTMDDMLKYLEFQWSDHPDLRNATRLAQIPYIPATPTRPFSYGFGWEVEPMGGGKYNVVSGLGDGQGYHAEIRFDRQKKIGAVFLSNARSAPGCALKPAFDEPCDLVLADVKPEDIQRYSGTYTATIPGMEIAAEIGAWNGVFGVKTQLGPSPIRVRLWPINPADKAFFVSQELGATFQFVPGKVIATIYDKADPKKPPQVIELVNRFPSGFQKSSGARFFSQCW
jgi:CubicO group peptidase (beta-lactamase class C family)